MSITGLGRYLIAIAAASVGIMALAYRDYAPAWHSFPEIPGREIWIAGFALILLTGSAGLCLPRTARPSLWAIEAYYLIWAVLASGPIFAAPLSIGAWYGTIEALSALAGLVLLQSLLRPETPPLAARGAQIV